MAQPRPTALILNNLLEVMASYTNPDGYVLSTLGLIRHELRRRSSTDVSVVSTYADALIALGRLGGFEIAQETDNRRPNRLFKVLSSEKITPEEFARCFGDTPAALAQAVQTLREQVLRLGGEPEA